MIVLVLEGRVRPGHRVELESFLHEARPYYESIGDVSMRFMWDQADHHRFREIFEYRTREAYEADDFRVNHDAEMQTWLSRWRKLIESEINVSIWHEADFTE